MILEPRDLLRLANSMVEEFAPMVWLGAVLGLRWGEVAGLRVGRIDLLRRTVTVAEQVTRGAGGVGFVSPPKSAAGHRTLSIPAELANLLSRHLADRGLTGATSDAFLFARADGRPLDYSNWRRRVWLPAVELADLEGLGFHDLRRTNATAMVLDGVDVKTAQARLGHSDPRLTLAIYAQATGEGDRSAAEKLGARLMTAAVDGKAASGPTAASR
jgi:integrase